MKKSKLLTYIQSGYLGGMLGIYGLGANTKEFYIIIIPIIILTHIITEYAKDGN